MREKYALDGTESRSATELRHGKTMNRKEFLKALGAHKSNELTRGLEYFLATGNLLTKSGIGLMQTSGFSVHTPDGSPCGLLNHLTASAGVTTHISDTTQLKQTLSSLGLIPHSALTYHPQESLYPVVFEGDFVGFVPRKRAAFIERQLRAMKVASHDERVPTMTELTLIKQSPDPESIQTQYPGLYIYSGLGRLMRPVRNLLFNQIEQIGIFEQVYLSVVIDPEEAEAGVTMHQELHPSSLFSFAGNLIPFPDHNQSPRNVYQCQMGKQTMGVPIHAWQTRSDNKMYKLQTPQKPLLKLEAHDKYEMDEYPLGTNACVAVISYTGYDMEDAMVINKASYQRGINLVDRGTGQFGHQKNVEVVFLGKPNERGYGIGADGLPIEGRLYHQGDCYYGTFNLVSGQFHEHKFMYSEPAFCGLVRIVQEPDHKNHNVHALIQWRIQRNPIIGDKFASRHGQKGINSFLWPPESLPFSESGMVPDIIFNPHGFPSRMTIGMMIESMAGKAAAMHGASYDASPFVFNEENTAIEHFGKLLAKSGYNYYGNETMYSGVDGREMQVQIFFGIVYYQRLRHMIADKFQVRSTGPVDPSG
uniref:DNA-directed RNA polymerase n=1 Tax=Globodera pallida TaxID=36090 RepID=A0A183BY38_GLOPA